MLNPEELKKIALAKRREKQEAAQHGQDKPTEFTQEQVLSYSKDLEGHVITFAQDGNLSVDYVFGPEHPIGLIHAVANFFKQSHPLLMVIIFEGERTIRVTWDGMNHV